MFLFFAIRLPRCFFFFFFNDPATTEIYTLPLHDALPIFANRPQAASCPTSEHTHPKSDIRNPSEPFPCTLSFSEFPQIMIDRKSTRLNSSHLVISYAVFCLKKKKTPIIWATPAAAQLTAL